MAKVNFLNFSFNHEMNMVNQQQMGWLTVEARKLNLVQCSRAVAILFVLFGHGSTLFYKNFSYDWFQFGQIGRTGGVDFFFVVSGFMIYFLYHRNIGNKEKAWLFLKKRAIRIYPLYWFFLGISLLIFIIFPELADGHEKNFDFILKSIFLLPTDKAVLAVTWSLSHIILFYIAFSLLIYHGWIAGWLLAAWAFAILIAQFSAAKAGFFLSFNNFEVLMGSVAALTVLKGKVQKPKLLVAVGLAGYLTVWLNFTEIGKEQLPYFYCIFSFLIMTGIAKIDMEQKAKISKPMFFLGNASYSVYLAHGPFLHFFLFIAQIAKATDHVGHFLTFLLVLSFTAASCCFVYIFIEKPLLSLFKRIEAKRAINIKTA